MKGNILNMSDPRQWLHLGLHGLAPEPAARVLLFRQLQAAAGMLRQRLDKALSADGITTQQAALLQFIEAQPAPPTLGQVAQGLGMSHQNAKQIASALARKGFLTIEVDAADRRARRLTLTAQHHQFWQARNPQDFSQLQGWTAALDAGEVHTMNTLLAELVQGLAEGADGTTASPPDNPGHAP